jgi:hypothetical protein
MEAKYGGPVVKVQCALKFFDTPGLGTNPCDMVHESFGLQPDGTLLASPWAVGPHGSPLHDVWVLGNLATTPMTEILRSEKVTGIENRLDENFGHCKIHAFLASRRAAAEDRILDRADPLYDDDASYSATPMPAGRASLPILNDDPMHYSASQE